MQPSWTEKYDMTYKVLQKQIFRFSNGCGLKSFHCTTTSLRVRIYLALICNNVKFGLAWNAYSRNWRILATKSLRQNFSAETIIIIFSLTWSNFHCTMMFGNDVDVWCHLKHLQKIIQQSMVCKIIAQSFNYFEFMLKITYMWFLNTLSHQKL